MGPGWFHEMTCGGMTIGCTICDERALCLSKMRFRPCVIEIRERTKNETPSLPENEVSCEVSSDVSNETYYGWIKNKISYLIIK